MPPPSVSVYDGAAAHAATLRALAELDAVAHAAVIAIYWQGRTQAQVADDMHLPPSAIRAAVARGLRQLAARIVVP